ncbi:MAG: c-type cytochrome [Acidobacteriota bacterium]
MLRLVRVLPVLFAALFASRATAQNPFATERDAQTGGRLFQTHCSYCHGARGEGGRGPDLTTGQFRRGGSDTEIYFTIRNGVKGTEMPSVKASDDDVWRMVAFVRTLFAPAAIEQLPGDPNAGKAVFESKGRCAQCHAVGPHGASIGPDLTSIGNRFSANYLKQSLLKPDADVAILYRAIRITTNSGAQFSGIRLNEDDISIQLRDTTNTLRSFLKSNLREIRRDKPALMPAYGSLLTAAELDNVVAYLSTLRGNP